MPVEHEPTFRAIVRAAEAELGGVESYTGLGVFGGDRIAVVRATIPGAEIVGLDRFTPFTRSPKPGLYESNLNCPLELTIRNLARRGIDARDPKERISFVSVDDPASWPNRRVQLAVIDRSFDDQLELLLDQLGPLLADHAIILYDGWNALVSDAHHDWLSRNADRSATTFCTFQSTGRAFVVRRRPT